MGNTVKKSGSSNSRLAVLGVKQLDLEDKPMCRYCYANSSQEDLIRPCECTGTIAFVHRTCLEKWLDLKKLKACEMCRFEYEMIRVQKPCSLRSFWKWYCQKESKFDIFKFISLILIAFPFSLVLLYQSIHWGIDIYYWIMKSYMLACFSFFMSVLNIMMFLFVVKVQLQSLKKFSHLWRCWRDQNHDFKILDIGSKNGGTLEINMEQTTMEKHSATTSQSILLTLSSCEHDTTAQNSIKQISSVK